MFSFYKHHIRNHMLRFKPYCNILGVHVSATNMQETLLYIKTNLRNLSGQYICVCNVHTTVMSYENLEYKRIQNSAIMVLPDGAPLSVIGRRRGFANMERVTGPDLMGEIFKISVNNGYRHFFFGSTIETLNSLSVKLKKEYPGIQIVGMYSPPYGIINNTENLEIIEVINKSKADYVWIGLGAPKQEIWMAQHVGLIKGVMIGVGAGFDYYAGNIKRAPIWMQKICLEWLYRLCQEPLRLFERYFRTNFKFIYLIKKEEKRRKVF